MGDERRRTTEGQAGAARRPGPTRRDVLRAGAVGVPLATLALNAGGPSAWAGWWRPPTGPPLTPPAVPPSPAAPILKALPPEWFTRFGTNAEMRWDRVVDRERTPNERFFVRNHTYTPIIDPSTWRLELVGSGLAGDGASFTYDQLRRLPRRSITAAIECAGNGRSFFTSQQATPASGTQWKLGAIGVARWTGVPLSALLRRAGITDAAVDVLPEGLDAPVVSSSGVDDGHVRRPLPVSKALDDVLVAYEMNGEPLPYDHGYPARLVVPGWIGIASIKWLGRIEVADHALTSPWNTKSYRYTGGSYPADSPPLTEQVVKSAFELGWGAPVEAGRRTELRGRSWSGHGAVRRVEVSTDGGATWDRARLDRPAGDHSWVRWSVPWKPRATGPTTLLARATDRTGATQPDVTPFNAQGYLFDAVVRHPVEVVPR